MSDTPGKPSKPRARPAANIGLPAKPLDLVRSDTDQAPSVKTPAVPAATAAGPQPAWVKVGVGVGSAALVAALLYATRSKRNDWTK